MHGGSAALYCCVVLQALQCGDNAIPLLRSRYIHHRAHVVLWLTAGWLLIRHSGASSFHPTLLAPPAAAASSRRRPRAQHHTMAADSCRVPTQNRIIIIIMAAQTTPSPRRAVARLQASLARAACGPLSRPS
ncbi:hypothetical protein P280DRAFT_154443 [Massarina eburnea CBS 473.64]|uniref:Uncharacterized protein n=1 Tax=Massarina eburnea CBS 473.64 TaxID=1395130 RepID=A0A6A6RMA9_9PLEO|nr:hypothetical protein P280DRAFT_154443 [Massarina eburnea CBS 473.64]